MAGRYQVSDHAGSDIMHNASRGSTGSESSARNALLGSSHKMTTHYGRATVFQPPRGAPSYDEPTKEEAEAACIAQHKANSVATGGILKVRPAPCNYSLRDILGREGH
jgi:hypothetical protein